MITIAIAAILLMVAVPSFNEASLGGKLRSYANSFVASAHLARSEAIKRNAVVTLCVSSNGADCAEEGGWEQGWVLLAADGTVIQSQSALETDFRITETEGVSSLNFQPTGLGAASATLTVCRTGGSQERVVTISATGRPSVERTTTGSCT